ncbi:MAG: putative photosynthetic complex assembly protein PuhE [Acetobacteraceae bacterium]
MGVYASAAGYALFVWWFSTGAIILLDNLPVRSFRWSMLGGTALFAVALGRLGTGSADSSLAGVYAAFTYAVLAWGWHEMSFFMGYVTGPRRTACPSGCGGGRHFWHGVEACLYHELAILVTAAVILAATWGAPNQVGTWTFMTLWAMRQSAKLNMFLGVRNLGEQFLPPHLAYLGSFFTKKPMNLLLPLSVTVGTVVATLLVGRATAPGIGEAEAAGLTFVITMLALAVLEHWMLVLPLPFERLWSWVLALRPGRGHRHPTARARGARHELRILLP